MKKRARILVVDDNPHNTRILESLLSKQGHEIVVAHNGQEALDHVAQTPPDLVVLDVVMPDMDGFAVTQVLRSSEATLNIPILMVTALNDLKEKVKGFEAGADDFLSKPFNSVELLARVKSLLRIKRLHDELVEKNALLEQVLMRYVSEDIAREILNNPSQNLRLGGQSCEVSVLFADIRGFTHFSERRRPSQVIQMLIRIFSQLTPVVFDHSGTLDKYLGDAIMAFYGAPVPLPNSPEQAVRTAWAMQQKFDQLSQSQAIGDGLGLGVGICTGEAVVGNVGSERIMDYTVIGNTPNTAKRLQECAQPSQILIDERTYQAVRGIVDARKIEPLTLKGCSHPVQAYEVLAIEEPAQVPDPGDLSSSRFVGEEYHEKPFQIRSMSAMRA
jgi:class 3 adenylate cyclase